MPVQKAVFSLPKYFFALAKECFCTAKIIFCTGKIIFPSAKTAQADILYSAEQFFAKPYAFLPFILNISPKTPE